MNKRFKFNLQFDYPELESNTTENGRVYFTPNGPVKSVTTILGSLPTPELDAWRERVGEEEAKRISLEATTIGSHMHNMLENYILDKPFRVDLTEFHQRTANSMFQKLKMLALSRVNEIWGVEVALFCENLWAGRTDLTGVFDGVPSIIDYKNSLYYKQDGHIEKYKLQIALYSVAHEHMFPQQRIKQGVLLIGIRPNVQYKVPAKMQIVKIGEEELYHYQDKALAIIENFYK